VTVNRDTLVRLARAGLLTGLSDALFASLLSVFVFHSTVTRVWLGEWPAPCWADRRSTVVLERYWSAC